MTAHITNKDFWKQAENSSWQVPKRTPPGFTCVGNWQIRGGLVREIGHQALAVLMVIASYRDKDGLCRTSRDDIAELMGVSISTVDKHLPRLKENGLLRVIAKGYNVRGKDSKVNVYKIHLTPFNWQSYKKGKNNNYT